MGIAELGINKARHLKVVSLEFEVGLRLGNIYLGLVLNTVYL